VTPGRPGRRALTGCVLVSGLLLGASSIAASEAPRYALGEVAVTGGNPIGNNEGIVYRRQFDSACQLLPAEIPFSPLSAPLGADLVMHLTVISCPATSPPVTAECRVQVGSDKSSVSLVNGKADLPVPLPSRTGIHALHLSCTLGRPPAERFATELYVTWRQALWWSATPRAKWYQRACAWGAGFNAEATEAEVLEEMLDGLYAYGQRHWRYGYGSLLAGGSCQGPCRFCAGKAGAPCRCKCTCPWPSLLEDDPTCDFGDCFVFAAVLQNLANLMGVMVGPTLQIPREEGLGFTTRPSFHALDPAFPGNLECGSRTLPCSYLFPVHALIRLHDVIYDPTFGRTFGSPSNLIAQRVTQQQGKDEILETNVACFLRTGYGGWPFYLERPRPEDCALDRTSPVRFTSAAAQVETVILESEAPQVVLGVTVEVEARTAGSYFVGGSLYSEGRLVTQRPLEAIQVRTIDSFVAEAPGRQKVRLLFSGEQVSRNGEAPLTLHAWLASEKGLVEAREIPVPPLPPDKRAMLGERPAFFDAQPVIRQGEGAVRVEVPVFVREAGEVLLQAGLSSSGETVATSGWIGPLSRGRHVLRIELDLRRVANPGESEIKLALQWGEPPTPVDWLAVPVRSSGSPR
jgi:hypothetical protein